MILSDTLFAGSSDARHPVLVPAACAAGAPIGRMQVKPSDLCAMALILASSLIAISPLGAASDQSYPSQDIRFVVGFAAGSGPDTIAHIENAGSGARPTEYQ